MGEILGTRCKIGRLFELTSLRFPTKLLAGVVSSHVWHSRLGHLSKIRLSSLISNGTVRQVKSEYFDCFSCQLSKSHTLPFSNNDSFSLAYFDLIHSNVWGPASHETMGGL